MAKKRELQKKTAQTPPQQRQAQPPEPGAPERGAAVQAAAPQPLHPPARPMDPRLRRMVPVMMLVFFLFTCLCVNSSIKPLVMCLTAVVIASCLIRLDVLRQRLSLPMMAVILWVVMNGASTLYALSGKFALREFLRLLAGFCCFMLILAWSRRGQGSGRAAATILEGGTAIAALISIDMLSTHLLSGPILGALGHFATDFVYIAESGVEAGVRMTSMYENPNVFAGIAGLGVLLALGLAVTANTAGERRLHLVCLFLNSLSFLLVFSMGASGMIVLAFLVLLILERKQRKGAMLILMAETLVLALLCAFPIFLTSFDAWDGFQPVPLLCAVGGAALLCLLDQFIGQKLSALLRSSGKLLVILVGVILAAVALFAALALTLTGPAGLSAGGSLRRADYPAPGAYTLEVQATGPIQVTIESQNQHETMMHTSTVLYSGDASGATFTVPEGSMVVYFNFHAPEAATLETAVYRGDAGQGELKLEYKLLPGFIANRLQGIFANENAIQRTVFFADGMKLFRRSPVFGLGLGTFETAICSVQSFYYETKYAHNHYVETLVGTGVVGLVLFLSTLGLCAAAILKNLRRKDQADPLSPALGAALVFMAGHASVEVIFSFHYYLPMAMGVLALICLCCGEELPLPLDSAGKGKQLRTGIVLAVAALLAAFSLLLGLNMSASKKANAIYGDFFQTMETAIKMDRFEWADYMLSYVYAAKDLDREENWTVYSTANQYAQRLARQDSNRIPIYLAQFYFATGQPEQGVEMLHKLVDYLASDSKTWQIVFDILAVYSADVPNCEKEVSRLYEKFNAWNENNIGAVTLSEQNEIFISAMLSPAE